MKLFFPALLILLSSVLFAQDKPFNPTKKYHPDSLKRWTKSLMKAMGLRHPGFYRYTSKGRFDFVIDSTIQTINEPLTELMYYRKMKPLFAQIRCVHTAISLSKECQDYLSSAPNMIPLEIFIYSDKSILVAKNYSAQDIPTGSEILSINGRSMTGIIKTLFSAIPTDGFNQTEKTLLLHRRFSFWYQTIIESTPTFAVEIRTKGVTTTFQLNGVAQDVFPSQQSLSSDYKKPLEFEILDKTGILKIHTFEKTPIKAHHQNFKKFMKATFVQLKREGITNLVVDLRYNTGGTDGNAAHLASYFFDKPFRYWDRIEVTEVIAKEIKGFNKLFYKKPLKKNDYYQWKKTWVTSEFDYYEIQKPAKNNYKGKTYILTNGLCLSSCADFVAVVSETSNAIVIGQETGGGFHGNTSGVMPKAKTPAGLQVTVPLMKYVNAVDPAKNIGRGTIPDHDISPTFEDWIEKRDVEMEFVMRLLRNAR